MKPVNSGVVYTRVGLVLIPVVVVLFFALRHLPITHSPAHPNNSSSADLAKYPSLPDLLQLSSQKPEDANAQLSLGTRFEQLGLKSPAGIAYVNGLKHGGGEECWIGMARISATTGNDQSLYKLLNQTLKSYPNSARAHVMRVNLLIRHGYLDTAYKDVVGALVNNPDNIDLWRLKGRTAAAVNKIQEAETARRHVIEMPGATAGDYLDLADLIVKQNRPQEAIPFYRTALTKNTDISAYQAEANYDLGKTLLKLAVSKADVQSAEASLLASQKLSPLFPTIDLMLADAHMRLENWDQARKDCLLAEHLDPGGLHVNFETTFKLAVIEAHLGNKAEAERQQKRHEQMVTLSNAKTKLSDTAAMRPKDPNLRLQLARMCYQVHEYQEAADLYLKLIDDFPKLAAPQKELIKVNDALRILAAHVTSVRPQPDLFAENQRVPEDVLLRDADALRAIKEDEQAAIAYQTLLTNDPKLAGAMAGLGIIMNRQQQSQAAFELLQRAVSLDPKVAEAQFVFSQLLDRGGFTGAAVTHAQLATQAAPTNAEYLYNLGVLLGKGVGNNGASAPSEDAFRQACTLDPNNAKYQLDFGDRLVDNHKLDKAEVAFRKGVMLAPTSTDALSRLAGFLITNKPIEPYLTEAGGYLQKAHSIDANDSFTLYNLGRLNLLTKQPKEAIKYLIQAVQIDPNVQEMWFTLSRAYEAIGDHARGSEADSISNKIKSQYLDTEKTLEAIDLSPKDPNLRLKIARIYVDSGENARAIDSYQTCIRLDSKNPVPKKELAELTKRLTATKVMPDMKLYYSMIERETDNSAQSSKSPPNDAKPTAP